MDTHCRTCVHAINIVGLGDRSVTEAKERVNSALKNSGIKPPNRENRKITINLAPADIKKTGSHYDLAIALGYLLATKQIKEFNGSDKIFLGELALDGRLRPISGALNIAEKAARSGFSYVFLPKQNANEAAILSDIQIIGVECIREIIELLEARKSLVPATFNTSTTKENISFVDFSEIKGQENAKRALTIAAAGQHNILLVGPPGVGKTLLSQAFGGILPALTESEAIEATKIWSAAGLSLGGLMRDRPFRAPHHTASITALVGGGPEPHPGEISLAHRGILFLDELPEFHKNALEALRQPMESGAVHLARTKSTVIFPARFTLIAAMNPCPCGYYGDAQKECVCSAYEVIKYQKRVSGPLMDRIDIQMRIGRVTIDSLQRAPSSAGSNSIKEKVALARECQYRRFSSVRTNADMSSRAAQEAVGSDEGARAFLQTLGKSFISPRGYYRLLKVARTIADLDQKEKISAEHLAEAFSYRLKEVF